jgi:S-adenosylmethionine synthetase
MPTSLAYHTAESVTEGHPDKLCDQIADTVLDAVLAKDAFARVSCDVMVSTGLVYLAGEITTRSYVDLVKLARETIRRVGYADPALSFDYQSCAVLTSLEEQSQEIGIAVDRRGAGDVGIVSGYATREGHALKGGTFGMPVPIALAHRLARRLAQVRQDGTLPWLYPDGKAQITVGYEGFIPRAIASAVVCAQHKPEVSLEELRARIHETVILPVLQPTGLDLEKLRVLVNPAGPFTRGGPQVDVGLSGRKIVVDTYGPIARHGGSSLSGKDPTKTDRSGAYAARWAAKNLCHAGLAERCEIQIAYILGMPEPASVVCDTFGTGKAPDAVLMDAVVAAADLSPAGIIDRFDLRRPIYAPLAAYGHFGRNDLDLPWEKTDLAAELRERVGKAGS